MTLQSDKERGQAAKRLSDDPAFQDACNAVERALLERWRASLTADDRERLWMAVNLLEKLRGWIVGAMRTGEFAAKQIVFDEAQAAAKAPRKPGQAR